MIGLLRMVITLWLVPALCWAQGDIPLGTWRMHVSYHHIGSVATAGSSVYAAATNGLLVLDRADNSITTYSKLDGLGGTGITAIQYATQGSKLLIGYRDGKLDVIDANQTITTFDPTRNATFTGAAAINNIAIHNGLAYLAADYGVVVFDPQAMQVKETWRDLGTDGSTLRINEATFKGDSVFLATANGVMAGDLNTNLLDFANWKRYISGDLNAAVSSIATFQSGIYAGINTKGIYKRANGAWQLQSYLQGETFHALDAGASTLYISTTSAAWQLSADETLGPLSSPLITNPLAIAESTDGTVWIGDGEHGLVGGQRNALSQYVANSPTIDAPVKVKYQHDAVYALAGGYTSTFAPKNKPGEVDVFQAGTWSGSTSAMRDLTDVAFDASGVRYLTSFGNGVEAVDANGVTTRYDNSNSTLTSNGGIKVTALASDANGLWVANYGVASPLHFKANNGTWTPHSFAFAAARYPTALATDFAGGVWMALDPAQGGGLIAFDGQQSAYLTELAATGGLPSRAVRSLAVDRDGLVWVGTDLGVAYFIDPAGVYNARVDAVKPIYQDRFLLRDDKVTALAIDGGNRKWMGTERGVWLFGPTGEQLVYNFTTANSPLPSDTIDAIAVDHRSGEVFFATRAGLVSFRADATASDGSFQSAKIFPNPVDATFMGTVGISGLATDAIVKITDVNGKLIFQTQANGGTASWNVRDYTGKRPGTGIYLVFLTTPDGGESMVGKIAIVD